ncbi:uncharacterized protein LOC114298120 [Camellia sinensis]|uniref:uncharacterized protein LOC114298120 n=1 Tax=Camellia sinensis TaxID=4442 RepID=UPI001036AC77|nr:uncharacterized protein LOC114298120 [Camellia sinensis]
MCEWVSVHLVHHGSGSVLACPECGRKHKGICYRVSGACFRCGKTGHIVKDCPLIAKNVNCPAASSTESTLVSRSNVRTIAGKETLRQGRVFALVPRDVQNTEFVVSVCAYVCPAYDIMIGDVLLYVDLLPLDIAHCDCILVSPMYMISTVKAVKLLRKGCRGYLCSVLNVTSDSPNVETIPVVYEFSNVFPNELPRALIDREIEFTIDVVPETQPISKTPYTMSTSELKEMKIQLQELLEKKFIHPSTSPCAAPGY